MCKSCATEQSLTALGAAIDRVLVPPKATPAIKLTDVVKVAGEKRRAIVVEAHVSPSGNVWAYGVMFRDGALAHYGPGDLIYVAPALA